MVNIKNYFRENGFNSKNFKKKYCLRLIKDLENYIKYKATKEEIEVVAKEVGEITIDFDIYGIEKQFEKLIEEQTAIERLKEFIFNE